MDQCTPPEPMGNSRKALIVTLAMVLLLGVVGISVAVRYTEMLQPYLPESVQRLTQLLETSHSSMLDLRGCLCSPDKHITMTRPDGLVVAGSLYGLQHSNTRGGILILHGNTPLGRNLPLYKIMATQLAESGYLVLIIDFTGFGESDDPFRFGVDGALDRDADVHVSLNYLSALEALNGKAIYLIGHSMGASAAMRVGAQDPTIAGIIAIGPPRRVPERLSDSRDSAYFWRRAQDTRRTVYGESFPEWYTQEEWLKRAKRWDIGQYLSMFSQTEHTPLLLIDGELEGAEDKRYLQQYFSQLAGSAQYVTLSHADHYSNSLGVKGVNIYEVNAMNQTVQEVLQWMQGLEPHRQGGRHDSLLGNRGVEKKPQIPLRQ